MMNRFQQMTHKVQDLFNRARMLYGLDLTKTEVNFRLRGRIAGKAVCRHCLVTETKTYRVMFNKKLIQGQYFDDMLVNTTAHEVAHIVCMMDPRLGKDHDEGWRRVCIALGGDGSERHTYEVEYAGGNYIYTTSLGYDVVISSNRHSRIQKGKIYKVKGKGMLNRACAWRKQSSPTPTAQITPKSAVPAQRERAGSYVSQIREWIRNQRPRGVTQQELILRAVGMGMRPSSARAAVVGCWDLV